MFWFQLPLLSLLASLACVSSLIIPRLSPRPGSSMVYQCLDVDSEDDGCLSSGYWYQDIREVDARAATPRQVLAAAYDGWHRMRAQARGRPHELAPPVATALFIPKNGKMTSSVWVVASSIKGKRHPGGQSSRGKIAAATACVTWDGDHKNDGKCAEMNVLSIVMKMGYSIPSKGPRAMLATYGLTKAQNIEGEFMNPCKKFLGVGKDGRSTKSGCDDWLKAVEEPRNKDYSWADIKVIYVNDCQGKRCSH